MLWVSAGCMWDFWYQYVDILRDPMVQLISGMMENCQDDDWEHADVMEGMVPPDCVDAACKHAHPRTQPALAPQ
jgi:hypothetical protein